MDVSWVVVLVLGLVLTLSAITQSVVGFGLAVVGAPFIVLAAPELVPGALLVTSLSLPLVELSRGVRDIDWTVLKWGLSGRVLMTPVGVLLVAWWSTDAIAIFVGLMVLLAVVLSLTPVSITPNRSSALIAGLLTGVSGTAASIGGPFLGLVLQHERPSRIRSTLAVFFVAGASTALTALTIGGQLTWEQVLVGLIWIPFALAGMALSVPLRRSLDPARVRPLVLTLAAAAGVVVLARTLLT
ncbi:sulfite exporter TauE/SafE family protein [Dermacoccaceae bacterium W4C1]